MPKFKKKPITVEAEQYLENVRPLPPGIFWDEVLHSYLVETPNGNVSVKDRDWIIKDIQDGLYYPCSDEIFNRLYDEVVENLVGLNDMKEQFPTEQKCPVCNNGRNLLSTNRKNQKWCNACGYGVKK